MKGIITLKVESSEFHQESMPLGMREMIDAKMSSEMPLPIPRWVISSPNHMSRIVPAVRAIAMRNTLATLKPGISVTPAWFSSERK